ncbi:hypothetical protein GIB67_021809 [Kingdonia uniflora]|uniref:Uncharacterized protein n=1 Tax=Kingdonia uniflora TaxID=39325 RepID=A0A7J7P823_9MAGN|nr:hypothetical protein GIB67_021809 [Kingdonia uniflora]
MVVVSVKPLFSILIIFLSLILLTILFSPSTPFSQNFISPFSPRKSEIWSVRRIVEWRPCKWWLEGHLTDIFCMCRASGFEYGYLRVDCYGGINKMRPICVMGWCCSFVECDSNSAKVRSSCVLE